MMYTKKQQEAIFKRDSDILVAAAAGSGKTSVLARRICTLIEEGSDIRKMLVCTFTNAAAAEMRARIASLLIEKGEDDARMRTQAELVQISDICTIDSFARSIVQENFLSLGVKQNFRIASTEECEVLKARAMESALEELYEDEDFVCIRDKYSGTGDETIISLMRSLYSSSESRPNRYDWLLSPGCVPRQLLEDIASFALDEVVQSMKNALEVTFNGGLDNQAKRLEEEVYLLEGMTELIPDNLERLSYEIANFKFSSTLSKLPEPEKSLINKYKDRAKRAFKELKECLPIGFMKTLEDEIFYNGYVSQTLYAAIACFDKHFSALKKERGALDFSDVMHLAYEAMKDETICENYRFRYEYLFIDEYQDTNPLQDAVLSAVGKKNVFIVGDIKQSIYRFRRAEPQIFMEKIRRHEIETGKHLIHMNENFRSVPEIIHPINFIMRRLMSDSLGEILYDEEQELIPSLTTSGITELLMTLPTKKSDKKSILDPSEQESELQLDSVEGEALTIAKKILELKESGREYKNICILIRKVKGIAPIFCRVLASMGIPTKSETGGEMISADEEIFVNLLKLIDGMYSDIALLSVMRSHIGGFDENDMSKIRAKKKDCAFSEAFYEFAQEQCECAERCRKLISKIEKFRLYAKGMNLRNLLLRIVDETDYEALMEILPGGRVRAEGFRAFFETLLERTPEEESLYTLIQHLEGVKKRIGKYAQAHIFGDENAVSVMSIHKSKGLEFPVVIIACTHVTFNEKDTNARVISHTRLGLAADIVDEKTRTLRVSYTKTLYRRKLLQESRSEELRALYVAMTRAKEHLIISGVGKIPECDLMESKWGIAHKTNYLYWILSALGECKRDERGFVIGEHVIGFTEVESKEVLSTEIDEYTLEQCLEQVGNIGYKPFLTPDIPIVPAKMGVSALLPEYIDGGYAPTRRIFTGAELGTLIHMLLSQLNLNVRGEDEVVKQLELMEKSCLFSSEEVYALKKVCGKVAAFLNSTLAERIRRSERVLREIPFSLSVPADVVGWGESKSNIVVQGIVDLVFEENDGLIILDYKSNSAPPSELSNLAAHYSIQMDMYERALSLITGKSVKEKYLYFIRAGSYIKL